MEILLFFRRNERKVLSVFVWEATGVGYALFGSKVYRESVKVQMNFEKTEFFELPEKIIHRFFSFL